MIVDHLEKCDLFSDFQYDFRSSWSTAVYLTVVSDRIARAFNRSGAAQAVALDISKTFDRVWHAGLLHKPKSSGTSGQIFSLISSFLSNRWLQVVLDGKSSQEYSGNAGVPQGSILGPTLFLLNIKEELNLSSVQVSAQNMRLGLVLTKKTTFYLVGPSPMTCNQAIFIMVDLETHQIFASIWSSTSMVMLYTVGSAILYWLRKTEHGLKNELVRFYSNFSIPCFI